VLKYIENSALTSVFFGPQGFQLFKTEEEQQALQNKYNQDPLWDTNWFVIGLDTELGDPYLIKKSSNDAFVYTGIYDGNTWSLVPVAHTVQSFLECLALIQHISTQQSAVFVPEASTVTDVTLLNNLEDQLINTSHCKEFWQQFFIGYFDWLEEE